MLSRRLLAIANLVKPNACVLDVGTDHAYLPIYLKETKICKKVIASDISESALKGAKRNIEKLGTPDIELVLSDGKLDAFGTHEELLETNAIYRDVYDAQTNGGGDFDEGGDN